MHAHHALAAHDILSPLENNAFEDSIMISFEIHQASDVALEVYDSFELKRQSVVNEYMDIGVYSRYINCFDGINFSKL